VTTVRLATAADADAIGRVQVETWRAAYSGLLSKEAGKRVSGALLPRRRLGVRRQKEDVFQGATVTELRYRKRL
jgi:hypothetical protein